MSTSSSPARAVRRFLDLAIHHSMRQRARIAKATGLSAPQLGILMQLRYHGGCGISEISEHFGITPPAASQMIERLVQSGLVERLEDPADRRARQLALTTRGRTMIEKGLAERYQWLDSLVAGLDPADRETVAAAMRLLTAAAQRSDPTS
jgi:DNA-binding MarR family transcriptional regulator